MRRLVPGALVLVLGLVGHATAQDAGIPPLERIIDTDFSLRLPVHECTAPGTVAGLARRFHFSAGVEYLPVDCQPYHQDAARSKESVNLRGLTIREALKKLSALDPRYRWIESDGVLVIRPVDAWADRTNMLNFMTPSFVLDDVNLGGALDVVVSAITGAARSGGALLSNQTEQASRTFSVNAAATSAGEALDAIVRAHGQAWWEVRLGQLGPKITFYTFDQSGIGASIPRRP